MKTYKPGNVPNDPAALPGFLRQELTAVQQAAQAAQPFALLQVLHAAPARTLAGMLILADGTDFNPGGGAGLYRRAADNASWVFIA